MGSLMALHTLAGKIFDCIYAFGNDLSIIEDFQIVTKKINNMLHSGDSPLFLVTPLEDLYWFDHTSDEKTVDVRFDGKNANFN